MPDLNVKNNKTPDPEPLPQGAWDRLWVELMRLSWNSVAIVPASPGMDAREVAKALAQVGTEYRGRNVGFLDALEVDRAHTREMVDRVETAKDPHGLVVAVEAPLASQVALLLARAAADVVVVAIGLGTTALADARQTIEIVGRDHVVGAVSIEEP